MIDGTLVQDRSAWEAAIRQHQTLPLAGQGLGLIDRSWKFEVHYCHVEEVPSVFISELLFLQGIIHFPVICSRPISSWLDHLALFLKWVMCLKVRHDLPHVPWVVHEPVCFLFLMI